MIRILFGGGDTMLGRAVQLTFPYQAPGEEEITDSCTASHYVDLSLNHPSTPTKTKELTLQEIRNLNGQDGGQYLWGDYLNLSMNPPPNLRVINLETAVTKSIHNADVPHWKGIRYHTHVDNLKPMLFESFLQTTHHQTNNENGDNTRTPSPLVISYANNHCMDYGYTAFQQETLPTLQQATTNQQLVSTIGAGLNWQQASKPAVVEISTDDGNDNEDNNNSSSNKSTRLEIFAFASGCSGTPSTWGATDTKAGIVYLPALQNEKAVQEALKIVQRVFRIHQQQDADVDDPRQQQKSRPIRIVSIHMGPNWANKGEHENERYWRRQFVHALIDNYNVDMIYGHSSHHCRGMEVYKNKLILHGTGDLINDYEGFENIGEEQYNKLGGIYVVDLHTLTGNFHQLRMIPMFMNRLHLERYQPSISYIWKPNMKQVQQDTTKSVDWCNFINKLSKLDSGNDDTTALMMDHVNEDPQIPGGPILRSIAF